MGGLALAITLSFFFSKKVSEPLRNMSLIALAMANGDFSLRITIRSNDEVGLLADSLNTLSGQLQEKLTQLERLDQTRREFVSNLSYEMKTPFSIIQAFTEALQDDLAADVNERNSYLNNIYEETARFKRLITDILDLKKMEEGHEDFKMNYVDLKLLASSVLSNFKGDKSRSRSQGGTRLGLAIVKRIIETHGGHISVWSKLGEGTLFTIILPKEMVIW